MSAKHTPGPWEVIGDDIMADPRRHLPDTMMGIASIMDFDGERPKFVTEANARLIAAAPTMLEALRQIAALPDVDADQRGVIAKAAIQEATGEQQ